MTTDTGMPRTARRVLLLNWRDTRHPEGGGSERYVEAVARRLAADGRAVTLFCAEHPGHRGRSSRDGVEVVHRGGRLSVYARGLLHLLRHPLRYDVVVDVQNGVPFWSRLATARPVVVLVHHVHEEVWPVAVGPLAGRIGWFLERRVAPLVYRGCRYVAVSRSTAADLAAIGVDEQRIDVVPNGTEAWAFTTAETSAVPRLCVVGRLVPHKQVEHAIDVLAELAGDVHLDVVGHGYWEDELRAHAARRGVIDRVTFHGYLDDARKHEVLSAASVHLCPSLKEGWGLVCVEAARHGVPTVAYRSAGGVNESVQDGMTGLLVDDLPGMVDAVRRLMCDQPLRERLALTARNFAYSFSWEATANRFARVLDAAVSEPGGVSGRRRR
jgi:glycosyltransferase involved in cell wall biosynthesis